MRARVWMKSSDPVKPELILGRAIRAAPARRYLVPTIIMTEIRKSSQHSLTLFSNRLRA